MKVREATSRDVHALVALINRAYRVEDFFVDGDRTNTDDVQRRLQHPDSCFFVIEADGKLAACVYFELRGDHGYFGLLAVDPDCQKRGYARLLIETVEEKCRAAGCTRLDLDIVDVRAELPGFYAQFGFQPTGATAPFTENAPLKLPAHLVLMSKRL